MRYAYKRLKARAFCCWAYQKTALMNRDVSNDPALKSLENNPGYTKMKFLKNKEKPTSYFRVNH